jgi:DnaJ-class molecular chaperone
MKAMTPSLEVIDFDCSHCKGRGYVEGDPEGAPIEDCPKCKGTGRRPRDGKLVTYAEEC